MPLVGTARTNLAQIGGQGGQCGITDLPDEDGFYMTDNEITCLEIANDQPFEFRRTYGELNRVQWAREDEDDFNHPPEGY